MLTELPSSLEGIQGSSLSNSEMVAPDQDGPKRSINTTDPTDTNNTDETTFKTFSTTTDTTPPSLLSHSFAVASKFIKYIGPGLMVSVAYMDPGNFSSSIASARFQYKLLFSLVVSNIMAGFLQIQACKLGICTGQDLASNCRRHLPRYLNYAIYVFAEISVIATDVAEIIGTAIAFNILFSIPLLYGVLLTIVDVLFVIMAYRPDGPPLLLRLFEGFVSVLVLATVVCFGIELANVSSDTKWGAVCRGFLPSKEIFSSTDGLYLSAALLGSNLMPHSLYLGSGVVQSRMKDYDKRHGHYEPPSKALRRRNVFCFPSSSSSSAPALSLPSSLPPGSKNMDEIHPESYDYQPSIGAIESAMNYTIAELVVSLITVALFVNAAILIVAGTALSKPMDDDGDGDLENADLFTLHYLLSSHLSKTAGTIFALALLFSGLCGGTVVTVAGQMIMEGHAKLSMPPGLKRILTRIVSITPCIIVVVKYGREGLSSVLNGSQVVLSMLLPFVSAPLIYLTCNKTIMRVKVDATEVRCQENSSGIQLQDMSEGITGQYQLIGDDEGSENGVIYKDMSNGKIACIASILIWAIISGLNFWLLASLALGKDVPM
ncbi:DEKNAAC104017 [Brettanomyces naardenensis]|uniref:DEKNAAC104017 n=1 Tax=Brettanomyces naardenensis TaxID=13370 RepID=A0A448YQ24_BRENA|nr:DEKNAAC104017 [Brettanomyces naardenensis]